MAVVAPTGDQARTVSPIERIAGALERIAVALERFEIEAEPTCSHPMSEREVTPESTMANVTYRCKACGAEGI